MFKKFILGSLLVVGLTACPVVEPIVEPPLPVSPKAIPDEIKFSQQVTSVEPARNDVKGSADLIDSTIDLDVNTPNQQTFWDDTNKLGRFTLDTKTGSVTFKPATGKTGNGAQASYRIKDTNGSESNIATIRVTVTPVVTGPIRILFIGNSRTVYNGCSTPAPGPNYDIPDLLKKMAANDTSRPLTPVITLAYCGASLQQHWNNGTVPGTARGEIARRAYDYVVLQANTAETDTVSELQSIVGQFNTEIKAAGAKTILYMNWSKATISAQPALTSIFKSVATNLGIKIAPVGEAWRLSGLSDVQLYNTDGDQVHALPTGAYATAATFYWMFYNRAPSTTLGVPAGVSSGEATAARNGAQNAYANLDPAFKLP